MDAPCLERWHGGIARSGNWTLACASDDGGRDPGDSSEVRDTSRVSGRRSDNPVRIRGTRPPGLLLVRESGPDVLLEADGMCGCRSGGRISRALSPGSRLGSETGQDATDRACRPLRCSRLVRQAWRFGGVACDLSFACGLAAPARPGLGSRRRRQSRDGTGPRSVSVRFDGLERTGTSCMGPGTAGGNRGSAAEAEGRLGRHVDTESRKTLDASCARPTPVAGRTPARKEKAPLLADTLAERARAYLSG